MQGLFGSNESHLQRQDVKEVIDRLHALDDLTAYSKFAVREALTILEELGNLVDKLQYSLDTSNNKIEDLESLILTNTKSFAKAYSDLQEENASLKQELKDINKVIDDPAVDLTMTASECILKLKKENIKLKQEILQLEAIIDD